ncbi:hypothetical protein BC940DRAFT_295460 [Gongronella butleri]|nr:hypothetical protein BC940DRAFT_295460 [Gongronella butleri]
MIETTMTTNDSPPAYDDIVSKQKETAKRRSFPAYDTAKPVKVSSAYLDELVRTQVQSMDPDEPFNHRLERVSSCLQQMIDEAKASLVNGDDGHLVYEQDLAVRAKKSPSKKPKRASTAPTTPPTGGDEKEEKRQLRARKRKSLQRLRESQSKLSNAYDQLNSTIAYHMLPPVPPLPANAEPAHSHQHHTPMPPSPMRSPSPVEYHHHHYHHHHYYHDRTTPSPTPSPDPEEEQERCHSAVGTSRRDDDDETPKKKKKAKNSLMHALTGTAVVFCVLHYLCHLSKSWSTACSLLWLTAWIANRTKKPVSPLRRQFLTLCSTLLAQWRI